jgi:hypothetical protein
MTGTEPHAWETGLMDNISYVGLDVRKATVCGLGRPFPDKCCRLKLLWLMLNEPEKPDRPGNNVSNLTLGVVTG